jgi:tetratricopeptide (TPR) repeat protein
MSHYKNAPMLLKLVLLVLLLAGTESKSHAEGGYDAPYFQADFTQDLTDWSSALVNPALLYRVNQLHLEFGSYRWSMFDGDDLGPLGYQHLGIQVPILRNHTFGATLLWGGETVQKRKVEGSLATSYKIVSDGDARFQDYWLMGHYSIRVLPWLMLGTNLKYRIQNQFGDVHWANIPGIDLGIYLNPLDHYRFGDLGFSLCFQDLLPSQIKWGETTEITSSRFRAGIRYAAFNDNLVGDVEYISDNLLGGLYEGWDDYTDMMRGLDSLGNKIGENIAAHHLGVHVKYMFIPSIWLKLGWTNNNIPYFGFNYNIIYTLPEMINYINVDAHLGYSFIENFSESLNNRDERSFSGMLKVSTDFGPTREQRLSKRMYDQLVLAPNDAYSEAMRLYLAGKYWEASYAFGKVISLFPNFHLNDKATWYLGNSYRFLHMNDIARQVYKEALEEYTTSDMRSKYIYGFQALDYREGKYDDALKNHAFITNLYSDSDIKTDADYLAGEIHFQRKNYNVAEQLLSGIKPGEPSYLYAQYTLSIINIENNKEQAALTNLSNIIKDTTQEASDQSLQDAANLKIGHLYFEMGDKLKLAVEAYQRVSEGSSYGDEALLGTAWAWIKVNQPNASLSTIERLVGSYPETSLIPEAFLVKGYGLMLLKRYPEAVAALEQCLATSKRQFITDADLKARSSNFDKSVSDFSPFSERIKKNALRKPTNKTLEERPELQKEFEKYSKESYDFFKYTLEAKSHKRFFMMKEQIVTDAEYALAKATRMMNARVPAAGQKKEEKIDNELDKLKKELENIQ